MLTYVFTGQGAQYRGMGKGLLDTFDEYCQRADKILGYSIKKLCLEDPDNLLHRTLYTQPAIYVVNAMLYYKKMQDSSPRADYLAGHSIGEYNALLAAEVFDFETGLKLVKKRAELMDLAKGGKMAAVIGMGADKIEMVIESEGLQDVAIANYNSSSQTVIAGLKDQIDGAQELFLQAGAKLYIPLNVSGAFHTSQMSTAKMEFKQFVESFEFAEPVVPVISNLYAQPYRHDQIKHTLIEQIDHSVQWNKSIQYLIGRGVSEFVELGAKRVLTSLIKQIEQEAVPITSTNAQSEDGSSDNGNGGPEKKSIPASMIATEALGSAEFRKEH